MILCTLLALSGFLLIYLEFFLPGGVMGVFGSLLLIASVVFFSYQGYGPFWLFVYLLTLAALLFFCIKYALIKVRKTGSKGTMFLDSDQAGFYASEYDKSLVGKEGVVSSDLKPSGHIKIEDKHYQAVSQTGYIEKGSLIKVIGGRGAYLICKRQK